MKPTTTALQGDLLRRIVDLIHDDDLLPGTRLKEAKLAEKLSVSRTPVRAALEQLAKDGFARHEPNRGMILAAKPARIVPQQKPHEDMLIEIARLRREGRLADQFAESELMRMTGAERWATRLALGRLEELGIVHRRSGYGWQFAEAVRDDRARWESYRFRMLIECAAIMEPDFSLDAGWADEIRVRHLVMLNAAWTDTASVALFEMNADFHAGICAASGNRYLAEAMQRQNQLRRLSNYNWRYGPERVKRTCGEHLEILERLVAGDNDIAAALMRRHLQEASQIRAPAP